MSSGDMNQHPPVTSMNESATQNSRLSRRMVTSPVAIVTIGLLGFAFGFLVKSLFTAAPDARSAINSLEEKLDQFKLSTDGRLENLTRDIFELRTGAPASTTDPASPASEKPSDDTVVSVSDLIQQGEKLRADKNLAGAEMILTRAIQVNRDDSSAWRTLAIVQRELALASLKEQKFLLAAQQGDRAQVSFNAIKGLIVDPSAPIIDTKVISDEEAATNKVVATIRAAIDTQCQQPISNAKERANNAYNYIWWNNRDTVVEGLKQLKQVIELGPWASEETRISANEAFSTLKQLVNAEEWNDLLARAGFDPGSRDTLRKWGLE